MCYFNYIIKHSVHIAFIHYNLILRLAAQCTAQLYSYLTQAGALAKKITCVGHSLGAHVCGMISNHLTEKQYKIIGKYIIF